MGEAPLKERLASRKFMIMITILISGTMMLTIPALLGLLSSAQLAAVMTGGEYVSLILGSFAIYAGANVAQRKFEQVQDVHIDKGD